MRPYKPYYLEDLAAGQEFETARRTITETDLMLSADDHRDRPDAVRGRSPRPT